MALQTNTKTESEQQTANTCTNEKESLPIAQTNHDWISLRHRTPGLRIQRRKEAQTRRLAQRENNTTFRLRFPLETTKAETAAHDFDFSSLDAAVCVLLELLFALRA